MKFRYKLMIGIIFLLCMSFGIGGTILIDRSYSYAKNLAADNYMSNYQGTLQTLIIANEIGEQISLDDIQEILEQLYSQSNSMWISTRLTNLDTNIIIYQNASSISPKDISPSDKNYECATYIWKQDDTYYMQISGILYIKQNGLSLEHHTLQLDIVYDISSVYISRLNEQQTLQRILLVIIIVGSILAMIFASFLTKPLEKLQAGLKEVSMGNIHTRINLNTNDEITELADNFNIMADTIERNMAGLKDTMDRQEQFMGSFAHELKTPMTSIIGYADLLRSHDMTPEEINEASNYIFSESKRLESLSLKLLELLVVENSENSLRPSNPADVIQNVVNIMKPEFLKQNIILRCTCENGRCMLDNDLFQSLITNLTDNARKAMDNGGVIHISGKIKNEHYVVKIKDNGRGMPKDELSRITEAFYRIDKSRSRAQGGAGLGLAICSKIAELHDAELRFKSVPGKGTVVTIILKEVAKTNENI